MIDDATGGTEHTVSRRDVSVHRTVEVDGTAVVATVELDSTADEPVRVEVTETFPTDRLVESAEFDPGAMPERTEIAADRLCFEQVVAGEQTVVVYELLLSEPVESVAFDPPAIETVEPVARAADGDDAAADANDAADGDDADGRVRRSVDVRLDRVSARIEEFAACAASLKALVDDGDPSDESGDSSDERDDDRLATAPTAFREELATVDDDVDSLDDELAAFHEELDEVTASMERVRAETATLREGLREFQAVHEPHDGSDADSASVVSDGGTGGASDR